MLVGGKSRATWHIKAFEALSFDKIILHNANENQEAFVDFIGANVLPEFKN